MEFGISAQKFILIWSVSMSLFLIVFVFLKYRKMVNSEKGHDRKWAIIDFVYTITFIVFVGSLMGYIFS